MQKPLALYRSLKRESYTGVSIGILWYWERRASGFTIRFLH